jgi:hypothetical protein
MGRIEKNTLSEVALFHGNIDMPKGFEINKNVLKLDNFIANLTNKEFQFSKIWDMLNTYIIDFINCEHHIKLANKKTWGDIYYPNQISKPLLNINPVDLKNSPDFTCLYGVDLQNCKITIIYDDNRRKGKSFEIPLTNNKFIMFPSTNMYYVTNEQNNSLNFIQTITYEYI